MKNETRYLLLAVLCLTWLTGCGEPDRYKEVAEVAREGANRQASQNSEMVRLNREVVEGTRKMIEADAQARKEMVVVHQELQAERDNYQLCRRVLLISLARGPLVLRLNNCYGRTLSNRL